uniref:Zinc finger MYM-type containing 2 n=1 Tax=Sinocyclocheilus grahami TaxID=75366 RepID=A0A672Q8U5_SINGR
METTPRTEQTPSAEESQTAPDLPKASEDNDDDVVLVEGPPAHSQGRVQPPSPTPAETLAAAKDCAESATTATASSKAPSPPSSAATTGTKSESEPIVIDDEEDSELKGAAASSLPPPEAEDALSSTEPDSEIKIASVTTLGTNSSVVAMATSTATPLALCAQEDINLMITNVTSLKGEAGPAAARLEGLEGTENGLQISSAFSLNPEAQQNQGAASRPSPTFNPGRISAASQPVQNGETGTHQRSDSWISQSASFPRNQKQPGVDSPSPAAPLSKPPCQSSSGSQQPQRTMKVTCANCKKPLKKGQTAYQRKGSSHLFCSTTCLSAFSHKPAPKKSCTMCKKDITNMKGGTIVAQVDSSESFQEFCSTGCLAAYENKQNPQKNQLKTKCTVCGKLTEIRHEVSFKNVTHKICSDTCFNRYRMANGLIMNCCEQCGNYLPSRATANHFLLIDGQQKRFCCQNCIRDYKQTHGKIVQCSGCKVMCRSFDATQCIGSNGAMESYCTTACMAKSKFPAAAQNSEPSCHFCKRNALPQYQAALPEGKVLSFCSSQCVTKFQNATIQTSANGQLPASASENIQLKCNYCRGSFNLKPEILEWEDKVYQFCSKTCCEDYKKLHCIVTFCEYCQEEKTLHETVKFSGVKRPFCSEGCKLLFKQDFARRLGLKCVTCNHCTQMCKKSVTKEIDGVSRDFCSETCAKKFHDWYYKAARCDCCKVQGNLMESVQWRAEMKHFCDQQCLLRFYCQQNEPNMATQKGPENTSFTQGPVSYTGGGILKDVKNKAVLCKPLTMTKATYCKPHMQSKPLQTGERKEYVPVPVPVPVYIPVPMNLYAQATPTPIAIPVPVRLPHRMKVSHFSLLSLSPAELNQSLSHFVKEVRRPNGESYTPDSLLYLCLSIQKHLQDKGRTDDLFGDPQYHMFGEELNKLLTDWQPSVLPDGSRWGRVEEQYLWSSGQLGEQTPSVLLRSLLYLNTKYFVLRTTEQHLRLSFGNFCLVLTVLYPMMNLVSPSIEQSGSKRRRRDDCDSNCEADSGSGGSAHCPVRKHECRLYELYLSKCPESVRQRTDFLYMKPEDSASSDSPLWFSSTPLEKSALARLLTRVLLVRDIYKNNQHEEEGV